MKKIQPIDETGRRMADERYGGLKLESQSKYGHSQMHQDLRPKYETPSHMADQRRGIQSKHDPIFSPYERVQDAPGSASGGTAKEVHPNIHRRQYEKEHRSFKVGPTSPDHSHKHVKRPGGYGPRGQDTTGGKPLGGLTPYRGKRSV